MCVIEMLNGCKRIKFKLEAGPDVITSNMKRRQELQVMAGMLPPPLQPILAKYYADTLSTDDAKMLSKDIVANMDPTIKLVNNEELDAYAIHLIKQGEYVAQQAMEQVEALKAENEELKRQSQSLIQELANKREERILNWNKAVLDSEVAHKRIELEAAKAGAEESMEQQKIDMEGQRVAMEAQDRMEKTIQENDRMLGGV